MTPSTGTPARTEQAPDHLRAAVRSVTGRDMDLVTGLATMPAAQHDELAAQCWRIRWAMRRLGVTTRVRSRARLLDRLAVAVAELGQLPALAADVDPWTDRTLAESLADSARMLRVVAGAERRRTTWGGDELAGDARTCELDGAVRDVVGEYARSWWPARRRLHDALWQRWIEHVDDGWAVEAARTIPAPWWAR